MREAGETLLQQPGNVPSFPAALLYNPELYGVINVHLQVTLFFLNKTTRKIQNLLMRKSHCYKWMSLQDAPFYILGVESFSTSHSYLNVFYFSDTEMYLQDVFLKLP